MLWSSPIPLLGALYLKVLDQRLSGTEAHYVRYMDDILVLTKTRWQLRRAVRTLNQTAFAELKVSQHPDKTFIGRIERGFDFLGHYFCRDVTARAANAPESRDTASVTTSEMYLENSCRRHLDSYQRGFGASMQRPATPPRA